MDNGNLQRIKEILDKNEPIGILVGKNATIDDMGAALALYFSFKQQGKSVSIACPTEPLVELSSLVGINKVKRNLEAEGGDLIVSFPYKEGEIEKVSYTLDQGYLNIVVKAGEKSLSFLDEDVVFKRGGGAPSTLFIVGTPRVSDLGNLFNVEALKNTTVINIDNKADNQGFGDIVFVSQRFSSVCEQIADLFSFLGVDLDIDIAQNLLSGISFATDNFQSSKTSSFAFETAAILMRKGAIRQKPYQPEKTEQPFDMSSWDQSQDKPLSPLKPRTQPKWGQVQRAGQFGQQRPQVQSQPFNQPQNLGSQGVVKPFSKPSIPQQSSPKKQTPAEEENEETPPDWLAPKIYKGSTNI